MANAWLGEVFLFLLGHPTSVVVGTTPRVTQVHLPRVSAGPGLRRRQILSSACKGRLLESLARSVRRREEPLAEIPLHHGGITMEFPLMPSPQRNEESKRRVKRSSFSCA